MAAEEGATAAAQLSIQEAVGAVVHLEDLVASPVAAVVLAVAEHRVAGSWWYQPVMEA